MLATITRSHLRGILEPTAFFEDIGEQLVEKLLVSAWLVKLNNFHGMFLMWLSMYNCNVILCITEIFSAFVKCMLVSFGNTGS